MRTVELRLTDPSELAREVEQNLLKGRAFVAGAPAMATREPCQLVVTGPGPLAERPFVTQAEAVWNAPNGVGLAFPVSAEQRERLRNLAADAVAVHTLRPPPPPPSAPATAPDAERGDDDEGATEEERTAFRNVHERVRALSTKEREDLCRRGSMPERVALERAYGSVVWELLLQNPQITPQEVGRIAKNGAIPRPLVATIVNNSAWASIPEIQRALLGNPRCAGRELDRVLSLMKPADVARVAQGGPYRQEVKAAARKLVKPGP
jgi:hypothetical protein